MRIRDQATSHLTLTTAICFFSVSLLKMLEVELCWIFVVFLDDLIDSSLVPCLSGWLLIHFSWKKNESQTRNL